MISFIIIKKRIITYTVTPLSYFRRSDSFIMEFQNFEHKNFRNKKKLQKIINSSKIFIIQKIHQTVFYCTTWWTQNFIGRK
jgi:hypothetical protein